MRKSCIPSVKICRHFSECFVWIQLYAVGSRLDAGNVDINQRRFTPSSLSCSRTKQPLLMASNGKNQFKFHQDCSRMARSVGGGFFRSESLTHERRCYGSTVRCRPHEKLHTEVCMECRYKALLLAAVICLYIFIVLPYFRWADERSSSKTYNYRRQRPRPLHTIPPECAASNLVEWTHLINFRQKFD